ncbi:MAG: serpin family protein [Fibrobacterota bacterium]
MKSILALMISLSSAWNLSGSGFACDLFRQLSSESQENICISPYGIESLFTLLMPGSRAATREEIIHLFGWEDAPEFYTRAAQKHRNITEENKQNTTLMAHALWPDEHFDISPRYSSRIEELFPATIQNLNFSQPEKSSRTINSWSDEQTQGMIPTLLSPGGISSNTRLIATNAVYFNGKWADPFDSNATARAPFYTLAGDTVDMPFMSEEKRLPFFQNDSVRMVELPYAEKHYSMFVLQSPNTSIGTLEEKLTPEFLDSLSNKLTNQRIFLYLPKWNSENSWSLSAFLKEMGLEKTFSPAADFSGISDAENALYLNEVIHNTRIRVSEEGTEAAGASAAVMPASAMVEGAPLVEFNTPFLYIIRHNNTGALLFMGRFAG